MGVAAAKAQTAEACDVPPTVVEYIVELRSDMKPDQCSWSGCERAPFSRSLCMRRYQQERRVRKEKRV